MGMAFSSVSSRLFSKVLPITLAVLMAGTALAACGSDPEPTSAPPPAAESTAVDTPPANAIEKPVQVAVPTTISSESTPQMEPANTPAPTLAPITIRPSITRQPREAPTVAPGVDATGAGEGGVGESGTGESQNPASGGLTLADFGPNTTWGEVFSNFSEEEQSCIRQELGDERLEQIMEQPFSTAEPAGEPASVIGCISEETGKWMLVAILSAQFGGLAEEQNACLLELLGSFKVSDLVKGMAPEPDPEHGMLMMSFGLGLIGCVPELAESMGGPAGDVTIPEGQALPRTRPTSGVSPPGDG